MQRAMVWAVVALAISGCTTLSICDDDPMTSGRILFESFKLETSWGYHMEGIYVDSDGVVWHYEREEPWYPAELRSTIVREDDLLKKYEGAERVGSVDPRVVEKMAALISGAAGGRVSRDVLSFERSGSLDVAYVYDARQRRYDQVFLHGTGDWVARNHSTEARQLLDWLSQVKSTVGYE